MTPCFYRVIFSFYKFWSLVAPVGGTGPAAFMVASMQCAKCNVEYEEDVVQFRLEACNKLYCFDDTPVLKCPQCEDVFVPEEVTRGVLARIKNLNTSTFPYHRVRWDKFQALDSEMKEVQSEDPDEVLANRLLLMTKHNSAPTKGRGKSGAASPADEIRLCLNYIKGQEKRLVTEWLTKKNLLKSFSWKFEAGKSLRKEEVASAIMEKIKGGEKGVFVYCCRGVENSGLNEFQYRLVLDGENCFFYQHNDPNSSIWKFLRRT